MRWDNLFDDLETQLERELTAEDIDLEAEQERLRLGRLSIRDRLVGLHDVHDRGIDYRIAVSLTGGIRLVVHPATFGRDWFSADVDTGSPRRRQCIVPLGAVAGVVLTPEQVRQSLALSAVPDGPSTLPSRLGLAFVLRDLCRRRQPLDLVLTSGELHGTVDRVGRDHLDLAVHDIDAVRRDSAVRELRMVPLAALQFVRL